MIMKLCTVNFVTICNIFYSDNFILHSLKLFANKVM